MIDMLLHNGDLVADKYGDIVLCSSEDNDVIQSANNNILLRFGNNKFHTDLGNKIYGKRIKANDNGIEVVKEECIDAILNGDSRIREVKQIIVTLLEDAMCAIDYVLIYAKSIDNNDEYNEDEDYDEEDDDYEELVEVDGRILIDAFNMEGGA